MHTFSRHEADKAFELLSEALASVGLPTMDGGFRKADAGEFMLMQRSGDELRFKHGDTRNYIYLSMAGKLTIPSDGTPFHMGYFDAF